MTGIYVRVLTPNGWETVELEDLDNDGWNYLAGVRPLDGWRHAKLLARWIAKHAADRQGPPRHPEEVRLERLERIGRALQSAPIGTEHAGELSALLQSASIEVSPAEIMLWSDVEFMEAELWARRMLTWLAVRFNDAPQPAPPPFFGRQL